MNAKIFRFEVEHPDYGTVIVESIGEDSATMEAAKEWDATWAKIAGWCRVRKLGTARKPRCRRCQREFWEAGSQAAYCPECERAMEMERRRRPRFRREDRRVGKRED